MPFLWQISIGTYIDIIYFNPISSASYLARGSTVHKYCAQEATEACPSGSWDSDHRENDSSKSTVKYKGEADTTFLPDAENSGVRDQSVALPHCNSSVIDEYSYLSDACDANAGKASRLAPESIRHCLVLARCERSEENDNQEGECSHAGAWTVFKLLWKYDG